MPSSPRLEVGKPIPVENLPGISGKGCRAIRTFGAVTAAAGWRTAGTGLSGKAFSLSDAGNQVVSPGRATEPHEMENTMKQAVMACLALFLLAGVPAALAQTETDTAHTDTSVIGMPIYTSDGMMIGQVTTLGRYRGETSMIGEVGRLLGFGTRRVLIPDSLATVQNDRVILTIPSDRVNDLVEAGQ